MTKTQNHDDLVAKILENLPKDTEIVVDFPTKGKFYTLNEPGLPVTLRPMTFEDERILASSNKESIDLLNDVLGRCLGNLKASQLIPMDKMYLLMKLREISYGSTYNFTMTCGKCGKVSDAEVSIAKFPVKFIPEELTDPREVELPVIRKVAQVKFPRTVDEKYLDTLEKAHVNLWRFVTHVDNCSDRLVIQEVIKHLPLVDIHVLMDAIHLPDFGIETKFLFVCEHCKFETLSEVPLGADFFTTK